MHPEILPSNALFALASLKELKDFYLAGGTALALQLGHRRSVDLDFFSDRSLPRDIMDLVEKNLGSITDILVNQKGELTILDGQKTKITFLEYPFPLKLPLKKFSNGIMLADILEIAAMKAYALGRRATYKDYVDIYFVIKHGYVLTEIIDLAREKYGDKFDPKLFMEQLIYLEDVTDVVLDFLGEPVLKEQLVEFFQEQIKKMSFK